MGFVVMLLIMLVVAFFLSALFGTVGADALPLDDFMSHVAKNEVEEVVFRETTAEVLFRPGDLRGELGPLTRRVNFISAENASEYERLIRELRKTGDIATTVKVLPASSDGRYLIYLVLMGLFLLGLYFFVARPLRQGPSSSVLGFGKSRHKVVGKSKTGVRLDDVAGVDEAKAEVQEIIQYLKSPEKFRRLGARIPKGVLLVGPPGTGKTLLAKATAGEADVAFFSASGSDFVEMFAGVGASRARDLFKQARESAPCILFLDEIDAVGRQRGAAISGGHDERDQTLNQILVEMDGFDTSTTVIVMAATNRPDILDSALMRPGRFDRKIALDLPDIRGREAILRVHSSKARLSPQVDLAVIARATPGFSGAELEAIINEAALAAALKDRDAIFHEDLEEARDKVRWGRQKQSRAMDPKDLEATAWHEAGHTLVAVKIPECDPVHKVTIIPRGMALGATMSLPEKDVVGLRRRQILAKIALCFGGRLGEQVVTDDLSTGASNDLEQATGLARRMVKEWGMGRDLEHVSLKDDDGGYVRERGHSEATAREVDTEVKRILDAEFERARQIIQDNMAQLRAIAEGLLRYETLTGAEVDRLVGGLPVEDLRPSPLSAPASPRAGDATAGGDTDTDHDGEAGDSADDATSADSETPD